MGLLIVTMIGIGVAALAVFKLRTKQQLSKFRSRHQAAAENLRGEIGQRRLVAENLIDALSGSFHSGSQLERIEKAELAVKKAIATDSMLHEIVGRQQELNEAVEEILPILLGRSYEDGHLVAACLQGWDETTDPIEQATLAYNDAAMTWNGFLESLRVRWLYPSSHTALLSYVDWNTDSSDSGRSKEPSHAPV